MPRPKDTMGAFFTQPEPVAQRPSASSSSSRSFGDKVVSTPNSMPLFTRRPTGEPSRTVASTVFDAPDPLPQRRPLPTQQHTNPFDAGRQGASEPPRVRKAPEFVHAAPRATGPRHLEATHQPVHTTIISPTGAMSAGGRRHVTGLPSNQTDQRVESKRIVYSAASQPCNDSFDFAVVLPSEEVSPNKLLFGAAIAEPNSRGKKAFDGQKHPPSLTGVMAWETEDAPTGFTYHPPWHRSSPAMTPRQGDIVASRVRRVTCPAELRAGEEQLSRHKKLARSTGLVAPYYCDPTV